MLAILMAFYRRPEVTAVVMRHYKRMADRRGDLVLVAVGSEGPESKALAEDNGWIYVEAPNRPLSDKLAAGVARVRELAPDGGMIAMGSDDLVTEAWIEQCSKSPTSLGLRDMFLIRRSSWEALYWPGYKGPRAGESAGAHRFFPRSVLEALGWYLWPLGLDRNLDSNLTKRLKGVASVRAFTMEEAGCTAVGISSGSNLTPWWMVARASEETDAWEVLTQFPEQTIREVMGLRGGEEVEVVEEAPDPLPDFLARRAALGDGLPSVSLVMIVKDSEQSIDAALRSAMPIVDEIVVVVDASTKDHTEDVALRDGASVVVVPWLGFAGQRNFAQNRAAGAWHILLDADETMEPGDILEAIAKADA